MPSPPQMRSEHRLHLMSHPGSGMQCAMKTRVGVEKGLSGSTRGRLRLRGQRAVARQGLGNALGRSWARWSHRQALAGRNATEPIPWSLCVNRLLGLREEAGHPL